MDYFFYCPRSERKRARWHPGSPARKRCWNIFPAYRILFQSRERETSVLFYLKVVLVSFKKKQVFDKLCYFYLKRMVFYVIRSRCNGCCLVSSGKRIFWRSLMLNLFLILSLKSLFRKCAIYVLGCSLIKTSLTD